MKRLILTAVVAASFGTATAAQTPSGSQSAATPSTQASSADKGTTTLTGCVYREKDVASRAPNVAERAGVLEDYILADVKPSASASAGSTAGTPGATGTAGTTAPKAGTMYKLEKIADEKLRAAVGKRVEVTGRIDAEASDAKSATGASATTQTDRAVGRDRVNLPEFEVDSLREVSGSCPAAPSAVQP